MPINSIFICSLRVSRDFIISKATKTAHKIFRIFDLADGALLLLMNFFSPKVILPNLQSNSDGLVGKKSTHVTDVGNGHLDTVGVFKQARYGERYA